MLKRSFRACEHSKMGVLTSARRGSRPQEGDQLLAGIIGPDLSSFCLSHISGKSRLAIRYRNENDRYNARPLPRHYCHIQEDYASAAVGKPICQALTLLPLASTGRMDHPNLGVAASAKPGRVSRQ